MRSTYLLVMLCVTTAFLSACSPSYTHTERISGDRERNQPLTPELPTGFAADVVGFIGNTPEHRADARASAEAELYHWRRFELEFDRVTDPLVLVRLQSGDRFRQDYRGVGVGLSLAELRTATTIDPTYFDAWVAQGKLMLVTGDLLHAVSVLDKSLIVAEALERAGESVDQDLLMDVHRNQVWALRDLGLWDEGLVAVRKALQFKPGDSDMVLAKGLLLAGGGYYEEALALSHRMKPLEYRLEGWGRMGLKTSRSGYGNRWIKSQALLAVGEPEMALHALHPLNLFQGLMPQLHRFWADVGQVAELCRDDYTPLYYALSHVSHPYRGYFQAKGVSHSSTIFDLPAPEVPVFASYDNRYYMTGSRLSYVVGLSDQLTREYGKKAKLEVGARALMALEVAERRHLPTEICQALRGRIYHGLDDSEKARYELVAARKAFKAQGRVEPRTSLLLGSIAIQNGAYGRSVPYLEEAVAADSTMALAWRSLGVSYSRANRLTEAEQAMTTALDLDPHSLAGLYNRGLFYCQTNRFDQAITDLRQAQRINPHNMEVTRLLDMATASERVSIAEGKPIELPTHAKVATDPVGDQEFQQVLMGLMANLEAFFAVPEDHDPNAPEVVARIDRLQTLYAKNETPYNRRLLAMAYMENGLYDRTTRLLAPNWGGDLDEDEMTMLLYADRVLGQKRRAAELKNAMLRGGASTSNPYLTVLAVGIMREIPAGFNLGEKSAGLHEIKRAGFQDKQQNMWWGREVVMGSDFNRGQLTLPRPNPEFYQVWKTFQKRMGGMGLGDQALKNKGR